MIICWRTNIDKCMAFSPQRTLGLHLSKYCYSIVIPLEMNFCSCVESIGAGVPKWGELVSEAEGVIVATAICGSSPISSYNNTPTFFTDVQSSEINWAQSNNLLNLLRAVIICDRMWETVTYYYYSYMIGLSSAYVRSCGGRYKTIQTQQSV